MEKVKQRNTAQLKFWLSIIVALGIILTLQLLFNEQSTNKFVSVLIFWHQILVVLLVVKSIRI